MVFDKGYIRAIYFSESTIYCTSLTMYPIIYGFEFDMGREVSSTADFHEIYFLNQKQCQYFDLG
jgi:hypothetical protein